LRMTLSMTGLIIPQFYELRGEWLSASPAKLYGKRKFDLMDTYHETTV
jgi:hypothetical protein